MRDSSEKPAPWRNILHVSFTGGLATNSPTHEGNAETRSCMGHAQLSTFKKKIPPAHSTRDISLHPQTLKDHSRTFHRRPLRVTCHSDFFNIYFPHFPYCPLSLFLQFPSYQITRLSDPPGCNILSSVAVLHPTYGDYAPLH